MEYYGTCVRSLFIRPVGVSILLPVVAWCVSSAVTLPLAYQVRSLTILCPFLPYAPKSSAGKRDYSFVKVHGLIGGEPIGEPKRRASVSSSPRTTLLKHRSKRSALGGSRAKKGYLWSVSGGIKNPGTLYFSGFEGSWFTHTQTFKNDPTLSLYPSPHHPLSPPKIPVRFLSSFLS